MKCAVCGQEMHAKLRDPEEDRDYWECRNRKKSGAICWHTQWADEEWNLPEQVTVILKAIVTDEVGDHVYIIEEEPSIDIQEFTVPKEVSRKGGAMPGDGIRVTWSGTDIGDDVVEVKVLTR